MTSQYDKRSMKKAQKVEIKKAFMATCLNFNGNIKKALFVLEDALETLDISISWRPTYATARKWWYDYRKDNPELFNVDKEITLEVTEEVENIPSDDVEIITKLRTGEYGDNKLDITEFKALLKHSIGETLRNQYNANGLMSSIIDDIRKKRVRYMTTMEKDWAQYERSPELWKGAPPQNPYESSIQQLSALSKGMATFSKSSLVYLDMLEKFKVTSPELIEEKDEEDRSMEITVNIIDPKEDE